MAEPLVNDLMELESNGIIAYDGFLDCDMLLVAPVMAVLADNPRHSEIMSHSSSKKYCRMCMVCGN